MDVYNRGVDPLRVSMQGVKQSVLSVVSTKKSPDLEIKASERLVSTAYPSILSKNWLHYASNCLVRPMNVANTSFRGHAYQHYPALDLISSI